MTFPATTHIAGFAHDFRLEQLPDKALDRAKLLILDSLGVALAAVNMPLGQKILAYVRGLGGSEQATLWGTLGSRTSAPHAALANGTLSSALDFDPGFHLTTHTLPAAIAAGEQANATGTEVLQAIIAAYEVGARLIEAVDSGRQAGGGITARGWYHVGFVGPIASALAAGKVLHLDQAQLQSAAGIAAAAAGGVRRNFGVMAKAFQAGNAASQGLQAATLAATGFSGDPDVLEAPLGLFQALGIEPAHAEQALNKLWTRWELLASLKIKRFPACTPAHQPVQAVLQLQRDYHFAPADVEAIEADLHDQVSLIRLDPADEVAAGFSLPFLMAVAIVDGDLTLDQVTDERIHDPRVRQLMSRVQRAGSSSATGAEDAPEHVTIRLRDGRILTGEAARVDRLDSPSDIEAKFRDNAARTLSQSQIDRLHTAVMAVDRLPTIAELASATMAAT